MEAPTGAGKSGRDRRIHSRITCEPTSSVLAVAGSPGLVRARVLNVSGAGMGLRLDTFITPGSIIRLALTEMLVTGEICFCRMNDDGSYEAGVLISDVGTPTSGLAPLEELARAD